MSKKSERITELEGVNCMQEELLSRQNVELQRLHEIRRDRSRAIELLSSDLRTARAQRDRSERGESEARAALRRIQAQAGAVVDPPKPDPVPSGTSFGFKVQQEIPQASPRVPGYTYMDKSVIRVGQVRRNRTYSNTYLRILAPPRSTRHGRDDSWLVEYLSDGHTIRRTTEFLRRYYPSVEMAPKSHFHYSAGDMIIIGDMMLRSPSYPQRPRPQQRFGAYPGS